MDGARPDVYVLADRIFNPISILFSSLVLTTIIIFKFKEIRFSNRTSLQLIMYISIIEIVLSILQMFRIDTDLTTSYVSSWGYIFGSLLICFLIMAILVNIQLIILYDYKDLNLTQLKKNYLVLPFALAMILSVLPMPFGGIDYNQERKFFWYSKTVWEWTTYKGWITLSILYCIFSIIFVFYSRSKSTLSKNLSNYIVRITFYSLIPILSYSPSIIAGNDDSVLNLLSLIFTSSQSIFTFIIFIFDPIIDEFILERKRNTKHKNEVLENIKNGIYVTNIYNIDLELPSSKASKTKSYRNTIYNFANRIKRMSTKKDVFNLGNDEDDILCLL